MAVVDAYIRDVLAHEVRLMMTCNAQDNSPLQTALVGAGVRCQEQRWGSGGYRGTRFDCTARFPFAQMVGG